MTAPGVATADTAVFSARRRFVLVAVAATTVDLVSKVMASRALAGRDADLPGPLDLSLAYNTGVAFSIGVGVPPWALMVLATGIATVVVIAAWRGQFPSAVAAGLVVGGAAANVIDRLQAGSVVDMMHTGWWPTFNLADVWITVGCAVLILTELNAATQRDERGPNPTQGVIDP